VRWNSIEIKAELTYRWLRFEINCQEEVIIARLANIVVLGGRLSVLRCATMGVIVLGVLLVMCWLSAAMGLRNPSHMYVALLTIDPVSSTAGLATGLGWSTVFGALTGALAALAYNAFAFLGC
jgi:hypothetical protein